MNMTSLVEVECMSYSMLKVVGMDSKIMDMVPNSMDNTCMVEVMSMSIR